MLTEERPAATVLWQAVMSESEASIFDDVQNTGCWRASSRGMLVGDGSYVPSFTGLMSCMTNLTTVPCRSLLYMQDP